MSLLEKLAIHMLYGTQAIVLGSSGLTVISNCLLPLHSSSISLRDLVMKE